MDRLIYKKHTNKSKHWSLRNAKTNKLKRWQFIYFIKVGFRGKIFGSLFLYTSRNRILTLKKSYKNRHKNKPMQKHNYQEDITTTTNDKTNIKQTKNRTTIK